MKFRQRLIKNRRSTRGKQTSAPERPSALPQVWRVTTLSRSPAMRQPTPARPQHAGRMGRRSAETRRDGRRSGQGFERRDVAVHAVEALDDDPNAARPLAARTAFRRPAVVLRDSAACRARKAHPLMRAGVDQFVVKMSSPRCGRVASSASLAEFPRRKQRAFGPKKPRRLFLQRLMLGMISAQ